MFQEPKPERRPFAGAPGAVAGHADGKPSANGKAGADAKAQANGKGKAPAAGVAGGGTGAAPTVPGFAPGEGVRDSAPPCALLGAGSSRGLTTAYEARLRFAV